MQYRVGIYPSMVAFQTILYREMVRFMRIWPQTLFPPAITMSLYFLIFGKFIGAQIRPIEGYRYIQYIVPGLVLMSIMTNAYANTSTSFFLCKFSKSIEEMLVAPVSNLIILVGFMLGGALRGLLVGIIVLIISFIFTAVPLMHPFIILSIAFLSSLVFSLGGLINAIYAKRFDDISFVPTFILTPLTYLGGVFYSISQLSPFWRKVSIFNPVFNMVDTFRFGILGVSDLPVYYGFVVVSVLFIFLFLWAWALLAKGVGLRI
jgi:ABC-2 type transport system permease protein